MQSVEDQYGGSGFQLFSTAGGGTKKKKKRARDDTRSVAEENDDGHDAGSSQPRDRPQQPASKKAAAREAEQSQAKQNPSVTQGDNEKVPDTFQELGLSDWLQSVCKGMGMLRPTEVQVGCIPAVLSGRDVLGTAQTGSGKTAAFALPILQLLAREPYGIFALVLTPTRELAYQIADQFRALGAGMSLKECVVIGGMEIQQQCRDLTRRPHVVIATPGRLKALIEHDNAIRTAFKRTAFLVLDEADRLLEPTFEAELQGILQAIPTNGRQTLLFSATMTKSLSILAENLMQDSFRFAAYEGLRTADRLRQEYIFIPAKVKEVYLAHLLANLEDLNVRSAIVFSSTKRGCHLLQETLTELEIPAVSLHSGKAQSDRLASLNAFRSRIAPILLATDVASRGLDIPTVDLVINFDLPKLARDYVHRVGRTARAQRSGWCLSFVTQYDVDLVHKVEELIEVKLQEYEMVEDEVLKGITKVYSAKRTAAMRIAEESSSGAGSGKSRR